MKNIEEILNGKFKRINIVGSPGAGKSTIAKIISDKTGFKLYDLDNYLYNDKCKRISSYQTKKQIDNILQNDRFVIDGTYTTTFEQRLKKLDLVVLVDKPPIICIYHFFKRILLNKKLKCGERITFKTLALLITFNFIQKKKLQELSKNRNISLIIIK